MDKVHSYIKGNIEFYRQPDQYSLLDRMSKHGGLFWAEDDLEPWERRVEWPELELLSAFEFLRPELPPEQVENQCQQLKK